MDIATINARDNIDSRVSGISRAIAITQPNFAPWLGYFDMMDRVDTFVYLDDVQYPNARDWVNRNRIAAKNNKGYQWITIPIRHKKKPEKLICNTYVALKIDKWHIKLFKKVLHSYSGYPFFSKYSDGFKNIIFEDFEFLCDLNIALIEWGKSVFGIEAETIRSSELNATGQKDIKLINLIKKLNGDKYLANNGSKPYIRPKLFSKSGIGFRFQDYSAISYDGFVAKNLPPLSFIDLLFKVGPERGLAVIRKGRRSKEIKP